MYRMHHRYYLQYIHTHSKTEQIYENITYTLLDAIVQRWLPPERGSLVAESVEMVEDLDN